MQETPSELNLRGIKENKEQKLTGITFVIVRSNGDMLLQLRDEKSKYYPNTWCFPGESAEEDEEPIQMVERGIKEEYGVEISPSACQFLTINHLPDISQEVGVFICKIEDDQSPVLHEGKDMRWVSLDEVKKLNLGFEQNKLLSLIEEKIIQVKV